MTMKAFDDKSVNNIEDAAFLSKSRNDVKMYQKTKRQNSEPCYRRLYDYFTEYCDNTSLHGFKYLGEQQRSFVEKLIWAIFIVLAVGCVGYLINQSYKKWKDTPVIVSFAQSPTPLWEIPFPAVTICSETKFYRKKYNFTKLFHKKQNDDITEEELNTFAILSLMCNNEQLLYMEGNDTVEEEVIDSLIKANPPIPRLCNEFYYDTVWYNCDEMLTPIITDEGVCYTFNTLDRNELFKNEVLHYKTFGQHKNNATGWTLEEGFLKNDMEPTYPRRSWSAGIKAGLNMLLFTKMEDQDYLCNGPITGHRVMLHHPGELPQASLQFIRIPTGQEVSIAIKPHLTTSSDGLRSYNSEKRQCYFQGERELRFFRNYTQQNCEIECTANATLDICGCVKYSMPRNNTTPICGPAKVKCMQEAQNGIIANSIQKFNVNGKVILRNYRKECNCLQACVSLEYYADTTQTDFEVREYFRALENTETSYFDNEGNRISKLNIFYEEMQFISTKRNELYGVIDFVASCGGIFGLFIGFSLLSFLEIIYYLSLRLCCNRWMFKRFLAVTPHEE